MLNTYHIALLAAAMWLRIRGSFTFNCHCKSDANCNSVDGSCPDGCADGWYGPGCQIGNLAYRKPAYQSSTYDTYVAANAVNGFKPPQGDLSERNCSHTEQGDYPHWWYVVLSDSEDYVLKNITIVNRQGINGQILKNFYILYTSTNSTQPHPDLWNRCTFQENYQSQIVATYTCERTAVGRRVAVYMDSIPNGQLHWKLALCEVYVDGYIYEETKVLSQMVTCKRQDCGKVVIEFSRLPVVPPTYLVAFLKDADSNETYIEQRLNSGSGNRSFTVHVMANHSYYVSVASKTCCMGPQCLEGYTLGDNSNCVIAQSSQPMKLEMLQYRQYELQRFGTTVNVTNVDSFSCLKNNQNIKCSHSRTVTCSDKVSCTLDPRYNYTCQLTVFYDDGFSTTLTTSFHFRTADFSALRLIPTLTCDSIGLELQNMSTLWDIAPSEITFYLTSNETKEIQTVYVSPNITGTYSATFHVLSNHTYSVWAAPVTFWSHTQTSNVLNESCYESSNCIIGKGTTVKEITTLQRRYNLQKDGCCVSVADHSPEHCEKAISHNLSCKSTENFSEEHTNGTGSLCNLDLSTSYTCYYSIYLSSMTLETYIYYLNAGDLPLCVSQETRNTSQITSTIIGGVISGLILLAALVLLIIFIQRRQKTLARGITSKQFDSQSVIVDCKNSEEQIYDNILGMDVETFEHYLRNDNTISSKFAELSTSEGHSCSAGLSNKLKNRFKNILPYDFNRVLINEETDNYINASYINGYNQANKYIATQGPLARTVKDFWKMVWQENVTRIIMLTDYVEQSKIKCERYFPIAASDTGGIAVVMKAEQTFDTHRISVLQVSYKSETRSVLHCHFVAWPDKSVPEHFGHLFMFYAKMQEALPNANVQQRPIIVHCSAGVGRTGAYIALDYLLSRFLSEKRVDVDSCVRDLRNQRMSMVQTKEQYIFLHRILLYGMRTLQFVRFAADIAKDTLGSATLFSGCIATEFELLQASWDTTRDGPAYSASRLRGETATALPGKEDKTFQGCLNAVYCNGCYAKNSFIAVQWPQKDAISDFWEIVRIRKPSYIVLLHRSPSFEEYPEFYPQPGQSFTAGSFIISSTNSQVENEHGLNENNFSIKQLTTDPTPAQEEFSSLRFLELNTFDFHNEVPRDQQQTVSAILNLLPFCKQSSDRPIIVVCKDGVTFCGLFLAATNSMHRLIESNQVQVFHTVDLLRASRPQFICHMKQYESIYLLLKCYSEASTVYANFPSSTG